LSIVVLPRRAVRGKEHQQECLEPDGEFQYYFTVGLRSRQSSSTNFCTYMFFCKRYRSLGNARNHLTVSSVLFARSLTLSAIRCGISEDADIIDLNVTISVAIINQLKVDEAARCAIDLFKILVFSAISVTRIPRQKLPMLSTTRKSSSPITPRKCTMTMYVHRSMVQSQPPFTLHSQIDVSPSSYSP
jgi:hypothetical protein